MKLQRTVISALVGTLFTFGLATRPALADEDDHGSGRATLLVTSTNNATANNVVVFKIESSSGIPKATGVEVSVPKPVCVKFLQR